MQELILEVASVFTQNVKKHCIYTTSWAIQVTVVTIIIVPQKTPACMPCSVGIRIHIGSVYSHYMMEYI